MLEKTFLFTLQKSNHLEILHEILALHNIKQFKQDQRLAFLTEIIV